LVARKAIGASLMLIYKTYDQQALDSQYNNRARLSNFEQIIKQWEQDSEVLR
jgi:hypothetical protein